MDRGEKHQSLRLEVEIQAKNEVLKNGNLSDLQELKIGVTKDR